MSDRIAVHEPMLHAVIQAGDDLAPSVAVWRPLILSVSWILAPRGGESTEMRLRQRLHQNDIAAVRHGFRSSFRDQAAEETDHPREVAEAALAHKVRNQVEAAYRRTDLFERRRRLMDNWAAYLAG